MIYDGKKQIVNSTSKLAIKTNALYVIQNKKTEMIYNRISMSNRLMTQAPHDLTIYKQERLTLGFG